jgi:epoxyqueuosine reductase
MGLEDDIKSEAIELGFDAVGITDASPIDAEQAELLSAWLKAGYAGQMNYMHRNFEKRINPAKLLENAQSVIVVGLSYKPPKQPPKQVGAAGPTGKIAEYAQYEDYHPFIKKRLGKLADFVTSIAGEGVRFRICVDSAPLAERSVALRAGLGFIGKNHTLIHPVLGPQIFLGEIVTTLRLRPDMPIGGTCAGCSRCMDACPTGALRVDGQFDANKCISYLTIEYKGTIPAEQAERMGNRLFGCDECVLACPLQKKAPPCKNQELKFYPDRAELDIDEVLSLTDETFSAKFAGSPIARTGLERLVRRLGSSKTKTRAGRPCHNAGNARGKRR